MKKLLIFCLLIASAQCSWGQFGGERVLSTSGESPSYSEIVDIDGDSLKDIVTYFHLGLRNLSWNKNLGNGLFSTEIIIDQYQDNNYTAEFRSYDYDNDSDNDIILVYPTNDSIIYIENDGFGNFSIPVSITSTIVLPHNLEIWDVDMDGLVDFTIMESSEEIYWSKNLGNGSFSPLQVLTSQFTEVTDYVVIDLDGDLDSDFVCGQYGIDQISWYENLGNLTYSLGVVIDSTLNPSKFALADLDGDSDPDLITASSLWPNDTVFWLENNGSASFLPKQFLYANGPDMGFIIPRDINNDGLMDIFLGKYDSLTWLENSGGGVFTLKTAELFQNSNSSYLTFYDLTGDGLEEVIFINQSDDLLVWHENIAGMTFGSENGIAINLETSPRVIIEDFDNDYDLDVFTTGDFHSKSVWFENFDGEHFVSCRVYENEVSSLGRTVLLDVDQDTDLDVAYAIADTLKLIENLGNGNYSIASIISISSYWSDINAFDLDNDGKQDLLVSSAGDDSISWFKNLGSGAFATESVISSQGGGVYDVEAADLDGDGDLDLAAVGFNEDEVSIYLNDGTGNYSTEIVVYDQGDEPVRIKLGDLDSDGDIDILVSFLLPGQMAWLSNDATGNFTFEGILSNSINGFVGLKIWDIDLDGDNDIVVGNDSNDEVIWLENLGGGVFSAEQIIADNLDNPRHIDLGDLDNDGDDDVVVGTLYGKDIHVFENFLFHPYKVSGNVFYDINQNSVYDSLDLPFDYVQVKSQPLSDYTYTNNSGFYFMIFSDTVGTYMLEPDTLSGWYIFTDSSSYTISIDTSFNSIGSLDFGFYPDTLLTNLNVDLTGGNSQCDDTSNFWLNCENLGTTIVSGYYHLLLDDSLIFISSDVPPDSIIGQNIYWELDSLFFFNSQQLNLLIQMPDFNSMGDTLNTYLSVVELDSLGDTSFFSIDSLSQILTCAYDPNDKIAEPIGIDSLGYIPMTTDKIEYTIRFQNTGNDTAKTVRIEDQLDLNLDWASLNPISSSHPYILTVDQFGKMEFVFNDIFLPDSIINEPASHGFVKYEIKLLSGLPSGTEIHNTAEIFFDFNPAVITNTKINTLYVCTSNLYSLAINDEFCQNDTIIGFVSDTNDNPNVYWEIDSVLNTSGSSMNWYADTSGVFNIEISADKVFCDEDTTVSITISPSNVDTLNLIAICQTDSAQIFGAYQSSSDIYYDTLQNIYGCDSILSQELIVNPLPSVTMNQLANDTICEYMSPYTLTGTPSGGTFSGPGVNGNVFDPSIPSWGEHTLYYTYTDGNGCEATDSINIWVNACLNIENDVFPNLTIYPNPFNDLTTVSFGRELNGGYNIKIYDALGREVYVKENVAGNQLQIQKDQLGVGFYLFSIFDNATGAEVFNAKLVVE